MALPVLSVGQNIAPPAEWDFASPSIVPGFELDDNWALTPIQASDGSFVVVGFSDKYNNGLTGERHPSILKYIPGPVRKIQWEAIPTFQNPGLGITIADSGSGGFSDVFESNENGTKYVYACGIIRKVLPGGGASERIPVIAKFYLSTGALVYFNEINAFAEARFTRMSPVFSGGTLVSIYIAGENCTLKGFNTSTCSGGTQEQMWEGIVVLGQPTQSPIFAYQGYVEMSNDAKIQDAYVGITAGNTYYNADGRSTSAGSNGGGMIKCQNTTGTTNPYFLNCRRSIAYAPVSNPIAPLWQFRNTNFLCNQPMADANFVDAEGGGRLGVSSMVSSWNRDKLTFVNCTFKSTGIYPEKNRGHGADNFDAQMSFSGCAFQQLYKGVYAQYGTGVADPTSLTNCTFTQVRHGGHIVGGTFHTMKGNTFQQIPVNLFNDASYGLRFEGATNLNVSETNTFSSTNSGTYGIVIKDSYGNASSVTRNAFTNVDFGIQTEQNNTGLQIRCNSYGGNDRAWSINPATPQNTPGLFSNQGSCGNAALQAGNVFNDPACPSSGVAESHIRSRVDFEYRSRSGGGYNANEIPTCVSNGPSGSNGIVTPIFCGLASNANACAILPVCVAPCTPIEAMAAANKEPDAWSKQSLYNDAVNLYLQDGDSKSALEVVKNHFQHDPTLYLGMLVSMGDYEKAQAHVESIGTNRQSKDIVTLYKVLIDLGKNGKALHAIGAAQESALMEIAKGSSIVKYSAQNILSFAKGHVFERPIEVWNDIKTSDGSSDRSSGQASDGSPEPNGLILSPNPATGTVEVRWPLYEGIGTLEVLTTNGVSMFQEKITLSDGLRLLSLENYPPGIYFVHLRAASGSLVRKLVIQ